VLKRLVDFAKLQFSAAVFGIFILGLIMISTTLWRNEWTIYRYDFLFIAVLFNRLGY